MRRREFTAFVGGALAGWPLTARAQQPVHIPRIGVLIAFADGPARIRAFRQGLQERGWTDGSNIRLDYRFGVDSIDRLRAYAAELVSLSPGAILANGPLALVAL